MMFILEKGNRRKVQNETAIIGCVVLQNCFVEGLYVY